ncbi:MAG: DNA glycosylase [Eubacterium sp.]|nr:DNA glycosylase [Eubacterium sp.]
MDYIFECKNFDPRQILFCGQCFRWTESDGVYSGIVGDKFLRLSKSGDTVTFYNIDETDAVFWQDYFDLDTDYGKIIETLSDDMFLREACKEKSGIRVLRQPPFETLISFIISQNNNIKRITGIISRLCESFGRKKDFGYMFPTAKELDGITAEDLAPLRAGFRAKYIVDAVEKVNSGEVDLDALYDMDSDAAREKLKTIKGVGDKVADCVLLFAYHKIDAFPRDVWIKRATAALYPDGLPECFCGVEGIAQQYLFDYVRTHPELISE